MVAAATSTSSTWPPQRSRPLELGISSAGLQWKCNQDTVFVDKQEAGCVAVRGLLGQGALVAIRRVQVGANCGPEAVFFGCRKGRV